MQKRFPSQMSMSTDRMFSVDCRNPLSPQSAPNRAFVCMCVCLYSLRIVAQCQQLDRLARTLPVCLCLSGGKCEDKMHTQTRQNTSARAIVWEQQAPRKEKQHLRITHTHTHTHRLSNVGALRVECVSAFVFNTASNTTLGVIHKCKMHQSDITRTPAAEHPHTNTGPTRGIANHVGCVPYGGLNVERRQSSRNVQRGTHTQCTA